MHQYIPETLGGRVRWLRERAEMTRSALARSVYVNRRTVARWESGEIQPRIKDIVRISELFCVSCDYIILGKENE